jgi:hypothetical protein
MKYLYLLLGLIGTGLAIFVTWYWIDNGFLYTINHLFVLGQNFVSRSVIAAFIAFWLHGIVYLYYGIKSQHINRWSNATFIILLAMFVVVSLSYTGVKPCPIGGVCDQPIISDRLIYVYGLSISSVVLITSLFKKPSLTSPLL